ncbi:MAG: hypothetical protein IPH28_06325 [Cytophagaceae bacterium]|nr:hypothetical protein [Cytophagaceae bacterium]
MTKQLAGYVFANEAVFLLESDKNNRFEDNSVNSAEKTYPDKSEISNVPLKPISIFVNDISVEETSFLEKILSAVNQPITNVSVHKVQDVSHSLPQLGKDVFLFGVNPNQIQIVVPSQPYTIIPYLTHSLVVIDSLSDIQKNLHDEKRRLWGILKNMFSA